MGNKKKWEDGKKLTGGMEIDHNLESQGTPAQPFKPDPRMFALVRMLARKAAERDYNRHVLRGGAVHNNMPEEE